MSADDHSDEVARREPDHQLITHSRVGKLIGLPSALVEAAAVRGLRECVKHQGQWYMFDPDVLPDRDQVIALLRESYREQLRQIDAAANAVLAEIEAVQDDARDALEHYTDPVAEFGDDLAMVIELRQKTTLHRYLDHLRDLTWDAHALHGCLYLIDRPDLLAPPNSYEQDPLPPARPRRTERLGSGQ